MTLRAKCALLVLAFEATLAATLVLTVRYIGTYFENAAAALTASSVGLADLVRLRAAARNELTHLSSTAGHAAPPSACSVCTAVAQEVADAAARVEAGAAGSAYAGRIAELRRRLDDCRASTASFAAAAAAAPTARLDPAAHLRLDELLMNVESDLLDVTHRWIDTPLRAQRQAVLILSANAVVGVVLGVLGLVLVRRWVLAPVQDLQRVTDEIGRGNLDVRARVASGDELGRLAGAVNQMSSDLAGLQKRMIQRERLAAMGELMAYVAHNIRNPLAGIQASAEASLRQLDDGSPLRPHQSAIVSAIDRFQRWLRHLEHACREMELDVRPVELQGIVDSVAAAFGPMADRRSIRLDRDGVRGVGVVHIDARHFEQALAAIVGNAIEAAGDGGRVEIGAERDGAAWMLHVADTGPGIPPDVMGKIFEPTYSTKRGGHGLGLAMARKVVEMHGGQIAAECPAGGGTVFRITLPARPDARPSHG